MDQQHTIIAVLFFFAQLGYIELLESGYKKNVASKIKIRRNYQEIYNTLYSNEIKLYVELFMVSFDITNKKCTKFTNLLDLMCEILNLCLVNSRNQKWVWYNSSPNPLFFN